MKQPKAKLNFRAFGSSLHLLRLFQKNNVLRLIFSFYPLKVNKDGFRILHDLDFKLSPRLKGIYIDFKAPIATLIIINDEHVSEFYSRAQELAREIDIANLPDGNSAALLHQFLVQLRRTIDPTLLGITNIYWTKIAPFCRNLSHLTAVKLPGELHDLYSDLEASDMSILSLPGLSDMPARSSNFAIENYSTNNISQTIHVLFAAYSGTQPRIFGDNNNFTPAIADNNNIQPIL